MTKHSKTAPHEGFALLRSLFRDTAGVTGEELLRALARALGEVLEAETTFIAHALDSPPSQVRVMAAWKNGAFKASWDYSLAGNPCQLTYNGEPTFIPCDVETLYANKKDSGYQSYIGIPLSDRKGTTIGHIAVYASKERSEDDVSMELAGLCGLRAEAEVLRMIEDRADREELQRLRTSNQARDELIALAGHELRAPLASVVSTLSAIGSGDFGEIPETVRGYAGDALRAGEKLLQVTDDLLDESRISAGGLVAKDQFKLTDVLSESVSLLSSTAAQKDVQIDLHLGEGSSAMAGDPVLIQCLATNLIANAIKYSPPGGQVAVAMKRLHGDFEISVSDQGPGVPPDLADRVFERFVRGPQPSGTKRDGSGLGLSMVRAIAEAHGGTVRLEPDRDPGARFVVDLPSGT